MHGETVKFSILFTKLGSFHNPCSMLFNGKANLITE